MGKTISLNTLKFGEKHPFVLIAGPCVIESKEHALKMASAIKHITDDMKVPFVFKASFDKANRTSITSYRGPGLTQGLDILQYIKDKVRIPVTSDIHDVLQVERAAKVLDILQIPAFLSRQTDLLIESGKSKKIVNIKKGQFLSPHDMVHAIKKIESTGNKRILLTERGTSFGYNALVSDFRAIPIMKEMGYPVVFDATHSVQQPGGQGVISGGQSEYVPLLARCSLAAGCHAIFLEVHDNPKKALSDGPNMIALSKLKKLLHQLKIIDQAAQLL